MDTPPLNRTPIVMTFDRSYAFYSAVTLFSALVHSSKRHSILCIVSDITSAETDLLRSVACRFGAEIIFANIDPSTFEDLVLTDYYRTPVYYRLLLPKYIEDSAALYLDSDIIVTCDICDLLEQQASGALVQGCVDLNASRVVQIPMKNKSRYINSGVLLFNLSALEKDKYFARLQDMYALYKDNLRYPDQCLINVSFEDRIDHLESKWNMQITCCSDEQMRSYLDKNDNNSVFHFTGITKPWMRWSNVHLRQLWISYARMVSANYAQFIVEPKTVNETLWLAERMRLEGDFQGSNQLTRRVVKFQAEQIDRLRASSAMIKGDKS